MKRMSLIFALISLGGLLMAGQALAAREAKANGEVFEHEQIAPQQLNREQITEMQHLLNKQGSMKVGVTGVLNEETMTAIRQFQSSAGLAVTGLPNRETLRTLAPDRSQQEFFGLAPEYIGE